MDRALNLEGLVRALAEEVAGAVSQRAGRGAPLEPGGVPEGSGWLVAMPIGALADRRVKIWLDAAIVAALTGQPARAESAPAVRAALRDLFGDLGARLEATPEWAALAIGEVVVAEGGAPTAATAFRVGSPDGAAHQIAIACESATEAPSSVDGRRLEAVLDVDLPLVVRFGQANMPLRALADLGPGAVIDMGRSPDEPVELLVGERVIARGEVVIVAGNYGVRITELVGGRGLADLEAKTA